MTSAVRAYLDNLARDPLRDDLRVTAPARVVGRFLRSEIDSVFQPIALLSDARHDGPVTAAQALARVHAQTGAELSPWNLFSLAASDEDLVLLDRRCRVVHTLNWFAADPGTATLLLNVHARLLSAVAVDHGRAFRRVLDGLSIPASQVAIVLPALTAESIDRQCQVVASYRLNGLRVAVVADRPDLLAALLARMPADMVRVDAHLLARHDWRDAFRMARGLGAEVHATRVEDEADRQRALAAGATHWQGWHLARPQVRIAQAVAAE